jgi:hypothetical protein
MAGSLLWKLLRRSMSTRQELLNCLERCSQLSPSSLCSNQRLLNFNKKRTRRSLSLKKPLPGWSTVYLLLTLLRKNGRGSKEIESDSSKKLKRGCRGNFWSNNYRLMVSRLQLFPDLTPISLLIFVSHSICN